MRQKKTECNCMYCNNDFSGYIACPYCGKVLAMENNIFLIYSNSLRSRVEVSVAFTERYIIVKKNGTSAASAGLRQMGLLGSLTAEVLGNVKTRSWGFYDLKEVKTVIYPYQAKGIRKDMGIKFVNIDGSEFIFILVSKKDAETLCRYYQSLGLCVQFAANQDFGKTYCTKDFVDDETCNKRICHSAAGFVQGIQNMYVSQPLMNNSSL